MNTLPGSGDSVNAQSTPAMPVSGSIGTGKEGETLPSAEQPIREAARELELPKEVVSAGVKVQPTVVNLPQPITQMGVKQTGVGSSLGSGATVTLPLTQPQIAEGLQQDILSSWRWLAVWCIRRLKQLRLFHMTNLPTNNESVRINEST